MLIRHAIIADKVTTSAKFPARYFAWIFKGRVALPVHDLHEEPFDAETREKLGIYNDYVREFLPVFLNTKAPVGRIQIFDFFAGPGQDIEGTPGSPILTRGAVDEALGHTHKKDAPIIRLFFNEFKKSKHQKLKECLDTTRNQDKVQIVTCCKDFAEAFEEQYPLMAGNANLVFLDQNGVKQITESVFQRIIKLPKTDLIFFISSAMVNRFKLAPEIKNFIPLQPSDYNGMNGTNVHRRVTDAYRRIIPSGLEYYLGSYSIKKGANVYGLVFGSGHPCGIDKFLHVAWKHGGDANFDIDDDHYDPTAPSLFEEFDKPKKISDFQRRLEKLIIDRKIRTNKDVFIFTIENGCLGEHAREVLQKMVKTGILQQQRLAVSYGAWAKPMVQPILFT